MYLRSATPALHVPLLPGKGLSLEDRKFFYSLFRSAAVFQHHMAVGTSKSKGGQAGGCCARGCQIHCAFGGDEAREILQVAVGIQGLQCLGAAEMQGRYVASPMK